MNTKMAIRKKLIAIRKSLDYEAVLFRSSIICKKIINSEIYNKSNIIYCYSSINNEVILDELMKDAISKNKIIALPKVSNNKMIFYIVNDFSKLESGYFGILEPTEGDIAPDADLVITPGVAFTKEGHRMGYGGGFYDRFFKQNLSVYKMGVAFECQILDSIPVEEHDIVLDKIIYN